jgi:triphosphoribosyl-dephospho-CoA synthase
MQTDFLSDLDLRTTDLRTTALSTAWDLANDQARVALLAGLGRQALIAEAELTPKPGLVDRRGAGAHSDLSLAIMKCSAFAIEPYFCQMAAVSRGSYPSQALRERLALIGRNAEGAMLRATGGSNSHKGAIWVLGLLISATALLDEDKASASVVTATAKKIASFEDRAAPRLVSHGDMVAKQYGVSGARGEAIRGFPHVVDIALPMLRSRRASGALESLARLDTLLSVMSRLDDTCLLYRGGEEALVTAKEGAAAVMDAGGTRRPIGKQQLERLDRQLLEMGVSPGGSGDLLAATLFLDAIEQEQDEVEADRSELEDTYGAYRT